MLVCPECFIWTDFWPEDLRGTRFTLSRDELLTLPEFVLLSLFPNGLLPDGHMSSYPEEDVYPVDVRLQTHPGINARVSI